jgi:hypothetical protein
MHHARVCASCTAETRSKTDNDIEQLLELVHLNQLKELVASSSLRQSPPRQVDIHELEGDFIGPGRKSLKAVDHSMLTHQHVVFTESRQEIPLGTWDHWENLYEL